jgi:hypothetical protein
MLGFNTAKNKAIDAMGVALAVDLAERFPVALEQQAAARKTPEKMQRALTHVAARALEYRNANALGVYGKARLLREFGAELGRRGYSPGFVEAANQALVRTLAAPRQAG